MKVVYANGVVSEKDFMFCKFRPVVLLCWGLCAAVIFGMAGACSPEHYKADADEEVYSIIDGKWHDSFGQKANYIISDSNIPPSPNDIQIEKAIPESGVINLAQAVAMATAHNRDYQTQKEQLYLMALDLTSERHKYARQWFGTVDAGYIKDDSDEDVSVGTGRTDEPEGDEGIGFNHMQLLAGGTIISYGLAIDWLRFLSGDPRTTLGLVLDASLAIPLLGSGAGRVAEENLTQAEREVLYQIRSFNRFRKTFVVSVINDYYRVLQQRDRVTNAENNYKRRVESKERLKMESDAGRTPRFEVDQAEQRELDAKDSFVRAQQIYKQLLDRFKITLALPTDANIVLDQNELKALEELGISQPNYTLDAAIETALLRRLDLANTADRIDDTVRKVELASDDLGPELNLIGRTIVNSREKTDFGRLQFHEGFYEFGFETDFPFDRKDERNTYREALIVLQQQQRQYDNSMDEVKFDVRQAYRELEQAAEQYQIQKNSLTLAEKRVESTSLLLQAGRSTTRDLLESQDALLEAQNSLTAALVAHLIAKLNFFKDVGILQVRPDGMWVQ
jgi:outer membrane protein TolC